MASTTLRRQAARLTWSLSAALWWVALCPTPRGLAQAGEEGGAQDAYSRLIAEGVAEFNRENFEEARALFVRAHQQKPSARTLRGLGMVEFGLRNYPQSVSLLQLALEATERPLEGDVRRETEALLVRARRFVTEYELSLQPAQAQLRVDGVAVAVAEGGTLRLQAGDHVVQVRAEGYITEQRIVRVVGGGRARLSFHLVPIDDPDTPESAGEQQAQVAPSQGLGAGVPPAPTAGPAGLTAAGFSVSCFMPDGRYA